MVNINDKVVDDFGKEWAKFDQTQAADKELKEIFDSYFSLMPKESLCKAAKGFDLGCGSGRWAKYVAPQVAELHCIDPSKEALDVARMNLAGRTNCFFHLAGVDQIPFADNSMDFGYSLGVLHHVPNTAQGIKSCVDKLKPGAPLLLYLYYAFDNRPLWFKLIWKASDILRKGLSGLPHPLKYAASQVIAALIYYPLARSALLLSGMGMNVSALPLSSYKDKSFYTMRNDALDRFGTRLEQRFTRKQIIAMMLSAGLKDISFSDKEPFWCTIGYKTGSS